MTLQDVAEQVRLVYEARLNALTNCSDLANTRSTSDVHLHLPYEHPTHHFSHFDFIQ